EPSGTRSGAMSSSTVRMTESFGNDARCPEFAFSHAPGCAEASDSNRTAARPAAAEAPNRSSVRRWISIRRSAHSRSTTYPPCAVGPAEAGLYEFRRRDELRRNYEFRCGCEFRRGVRLQPDPTSAPLQLLHPRRTEDVAERVVAFVTGVLVDERVGA